MKNTICYVLIAVLLFTLVGCAGGENSTQPPVFENQSPDFITDPPATEAPVTYDITDYTLSGMVNVTDVCFSAKNAQGHYAEVDPKHGSPTAITISIMCPICNEEAFFILELSEISQAKIGQPSFTWTGEHDCYNWVNHEDHFDSTYNYSVLFTLNP